MMGSLEYSPLQKVSRVGDEQVQIYIYRQPQESWRLLLVNAHGASRVLEKNFDTDVQALGYFDDVCKYNSDKLFPADLIELVKEMPHVNASLLSPQYAWYRDMKSRALFTLCKFDLVHKYAGLWPAQNLQGHKITGYLYSGDSPAWPHPPRGLPGAPENIEVEFTILPKHIGIPPNL